MISTWWPMREIYHHSLKNQKLYSYDAVLRAFAQILGSRLLPLSFKARIKLAKVDLISLNPACERGRKAINRVRLSNECLTTKLAAEGTQ